MPTFIKSALIDAPVEDVFRFHERPDAFELLSPPFPPVRVISRTGRGIETGLRLELRVAGFRWTALHTTYEKDRLFVDEQIEGPFAKWVHRHEFEPLGAQTRLTDRIEYQLRGGPVVNLLFAWVVRFGLRNLFVHRHRVTRALTKPRLTPNRRLN